MNEDVVKRLRGAGGFRYPAGTRSAGFTTTRVRPLPDCDAQISLRCNDAGRAVSLLSSETELGRSQ
ncbi:hypothetical protein SY2F82_19970 [Streptomyces sp. Y2F8-2]|nr:hypothetical protein SY2F82_19970 [Streptomyces sp. Y2F8-2]